MADVVSVVVVPFVALISKTFMAYRMRKARIAGDLMRHHINLCFIKSDWQKYHVAFDGIGERLKSKLANLLLLLMYILIYTQMLHIEGVNFLNDLFSGKLLVNVGC